MGKLRVAVLFGGSSAEYEVSLKSAYSIITNMDREKYELILIGITRDGRWLRYLGDAEKIRQDLWEADDLCHPVFISSNRGFKGILELREGSAALLPVDAVFPVLHGAFGEDGTLQGLLDMAGIPYVGCGVLASAAGMDKAMAHSLAAAAGVDTPRSAVFYKGDSLAEISQGVWKFQYPLYVKPARGGSSLGITKAEDPAMLFEAVRTAFGWDSKIVIEENVEGFEVGCAILEDQGLFLGEVDELQLHGAVFDYKEKYSMTKTIHHIPARICEEVMQRIKKDAIVIYRSLGCRGLARVDFFLTPEGSVVFNEINTMPGFTTGSRYPKMLMAAGLSFPEILDRLISGALGPESRAEKRPEAQREIGWLRETGEESSRPSEENPPKENPPKGNPPKGNPSAMRCQGAGSPPETRRENRPATAF